MASIQLDICSDASSSDFTDDDFLDVGDEFGTIVDCDPVSGQMGFADFSFSEFLDYSRRIVVLARSHQAPPIQPKPGIQNELEYNVARATFDALTSELDKKYQGNSWLPLDPYVINYVELFTALRQYEQRKNELAIQQKEQIAEASAQAPDSEGGEI
jgi:hypothetical protein